MEKIKILIATQETNVLVNDGVYMPIYVGKALSNKDINIQGDDTGDNISSKNPYYCELTATYWAWKNLKDVDYIGLCHYRRYFDFSFKPHIMKEQRQVSADFIVNNKNKLAPKIPYDCDVILPVSNPYIYNLISSHLFNLSVTDVILLEKTILYLFPDYKESIKHIFYHKQYIPQRNMFVMRRDLFDKYCEFLFSILFEVEKHLKHSLYKYEQRSLAFMGELLLPLFCYHNKLKIKNRQILFVTNNPQNSSIFKDVLIHCFNKFRFTINCYSKKTKLISDTYEHIFNKEFSNIYTNSSCNIY